MSVGDLGVGGEAAAVTGDEKGLFHEKISRGETTDSIVKWGSRLGFCLGKKGGGGRGGRGEGDLSIVVRKDWSGDYLRRVGGGEEHRPCIAVS